MFKKVLSLILFLSISISALAQSKVGTIDVDFILSKMPELLTVQANLEAYGKTLDADMEVKYKQYETLLKTYQASEANYSNEEKLEKQTELRALEGEINKFRQNGTTLVNLRKEDELRPLYQKIGEALQKVATTGQFTQIFQLTDDLVYTDPTLDVTEAVCKELGITITKE